MSRTLRVLVAALALIALAAAPATAEDASIAYVEPTRDGLQLLVSVPPDVEVDLDDVTVTVDGTATTARAERAGTTTTVRRTAILVIDTSNSMRGERFAAAQSAATSYLDAIPADVGVGIVSFAASTRELLAPTTDRALARAVVADLTLERETRLYDGLLTAIGMAGREGQRSLLVLSDGADTSDTELDQVVQRIRDAGVLVDAVALDQRGRAREALASLTSAGGGAVIDADTDALSEAFAAEADVLARQLVVTTELPEGIQGTEATVRVTLQSSAGELTAEAFTRVRRQSGAAAPGVTLAPPEQVTTVSREWMYVGLAALGLAIVGLAVGLLLPRREPDMSPAERAMLYTERVDGRAAKGQGKGRAEPEPALNQARDAAARVLARNTGLAVRIAARLEGAGNPLKPAEWLLLHVAIIIGAGLLGVLLGQGSPVMAVLMLAVGVIGPWVWLGVRRGQRRKAFNAGLPDTLQLMSGSLAAGLSLAQSVDTIVREGQEPVSSEFKRVLVETRLGVSLEDALQGVADRFESKDFGWVVMAIKIQRQVGGNLAELLDTVAATMREREYVRRQVSALAAEGKLSAWVLGGLPPAFMLYLLLTNRDYVIVMFQHPVGWAMLIGAGLLLTVGVFWMTRLTKVEV